MYLRENAEVKRKLMSFGVLAVMCLCGYSSKALPTFKGCSSVKVGITVFLGKNGNGSVWAPDAKIDRSGHWHYKGEVYTFGEVCKALYYGSGCEPIYEFTPAGEYYHANVADIPILPASWSKDAFFQPLYDELVEAKKVAISERKEAAARTKNIALYGVFKRFLGMTLAGEIEVDLGGQEEKGSVVKEFNPKGEGLPGFEKYVVHATPKSHRVFKISAIHEGGTVTNARYVVKYLMARYDGLKFKEKSKNGESLKWECKMIKSENSKANRTLTVLKDKERCVVSLVDSAGVSAAKNEAENRCTKCSGAGSVSVVVKCSLCQGTMNRLCEKCNGTKFVPCGDCWDGKKKCGSCHGKGKVKCMWCNGTGRRTYCDHCTDGTEERSVKCQMCLGTGKCKLAPRRRGVE